MNDFLENETAMISLAATAITALLTGPVFRMDPAAVGTITAAVVAVFNLWVRFSVYSKKGAAKVATAAATQAVEALTDETVGPEGDITIIGVATVHNAVQDAMGANSPPA